jgi:hypothetical protein
MEYLSWYHFLVLHVAVLLRLLVLYMQMEGEFKKETKILSFNIFVSDKWDNMAAHYVSAWLLILILPPLIDLSGELAPFMKEIKNLPSVNVLATATVGYLGYDLAMSILDKVKSKVS